MKNKGMRKLAEAQAIMAARRAADRDDEAHAIAQRVYGYAIDIKAMGPSPVPLAISAPLTAAAELAALSVVRREGLEENEANVNDLAAYFVAVFREAVTVVDSDQLARLRASAPGMTGGEHGSDDRGAAAPDGPGEGEPGPPGAG